MVNLPEVVGATGVCVRTGSNPWIVTLLLLLLLAFPGPTAAAPPTVVINEVLYHPADDSLAGEFVELHNYGDEPVDLAGWSITGGIDFLFRTHVTIPPGGFLVVAADAESIVTRYGLEPSLVVGDYNRNLSNEGETVRLVDSTGYLVSFVDYDDSHPWPETADGLGPSLERVSPRREEPDARAWDASIPVGGTPGRENSVHIEDGQAHEPGWVELIAWGADWRFFRGVEQPPPDWNEATFNDGSWESGPAGFGYGDDDDSTVLEDMEGNYTVVYIRTTFTAEDLDLLDSVSLEVNYDDGFIAYLNGVEVARANVPIGNTHEAGIPESFDIADWQALLQEGENLLAMEGHNGDPTSSDFSLSPALFGRLRDDEEPPDPPLSRPFRDLVVNEIAVGGDGTGWVEVYNPTPAPVDAARRRITLHPPEIGSYTFPPGTVVAPQDHLVLTESVLGFELDGIHALLVVNEEGHFIDGLNPRTTDPTHSSGRLPDGSDNRVVFPEPTRGAPNVLEASEPVVINEILYHPLEGVGDIEYLELYNRSAAPVDLSGWAFTQGVDYALPPGTVLEAGGFLVVAYDPVAFSLRYGDIEALGPWTGRLRNDAETIVLRDALGNVADRVRYADEGSWPESTDGEGPSIELVHPGLDNRYGPAWRASDGEGTPGSVNSRFQDDPLPIIAGVEHQPVVPDSSSPVRVLASVSDEREITTVTLFHELDEGGGGPSVPMRDDGLIDDGIPGNGIYGADIPNYPDGFIIAFWIRAEAVGGQSASVPEGAPQPAFLYQVEDSTPQAARPVYRIIMRDRNLDELRTRGAQSDELLDLTFIANGRAYYNRGIRYRGSSARRCDPMSYRIQFDHDRSLHGIQRLNLNGCNAYRQWLGLDFLRRTGVPTPVSWFRKLSFNGRLDSGWHLRVEAIDAEFLERLFPDDSDGNLYRGEGQANLDYRGEDAGDYRRDYRKDTNEEEADYSDVADLCFRLDEDTTPDEEYVAAVEERVDVQQWANYFAAFAILGSTENSILLDNGDDYFLYHRYSDDRWILLPWDLDSCFDEDTQRLFRPTVDSVQRFLRHPEFGPLYWCHLEYLMESAFQPELVDSRIDHLVPLFPPGNIQALRSYVPRRRDYIHERMSETLDMSLTRGGSVCDGVLYPSRSALLLSGQAPGCGTSGVLVDGLPADYDLQTTTWSLDIDISHRTDIRVETLDRHGDVLQASEVTVEEVIGGSTGGEPGLHVQTAGTDYLAFKAAQVSMITDPDDDGHVWREVTGVTGALGATGSILKAPEDGRNRELGQSHAIYSCRFLAYGSYRSYFRMRGFNSMTDSIWRPVGFNRPPEVSVRANDGSFGWAAEGDLSVTRDHVEQETVLDFVIGVREFNTEVDAIVLSLNPNLSPQQLDALVEDADVPVPPRPIVDILPSSELSLSGEGVATGTLDGSRSHDGRCESGSLTYLWEKLEGPDGDSFLDSPSAPSVEVEFRLPGVYRYSLTVTSPGGDSSVEAGITVLPPSGNDFLRCDANGDGEHNITDAIFTLGWLFLGGSPAPCSTAMDCDANGERNLTDAVFGLNHLFQGTPPPPGPYPACETAPVESCAVSTCAQ